MANGLAQRARDNAVARNNPDQSTLQGDIRSMQHQFALAMPKGAEAAQLVRDALTALRSTPKLAQCSRESVLGGLMTCAQLGLRPGVLGHAWLLPFYNKRSRSFDAQLVIGYQGLIELAHRSGKIDSLIARTVHENDHFSVDYGLEDNLVHRPAMTGPRGEPVGYYAIVKFTSGGHAFLYMTQDEMNAYRDRYAMARAKDGTIVGPWRDQFEGMAHKTCVRQLSKWMPKSTDLAAGLEADNSVRLDLAPDADPVHASEHPDDVIDGEEVTDDQPPAEEPPPNVDTTTGEVRDGENGGE